jgi:uncharacterized protein YkwD
MSFIKNLLIALLILPLFLGLTNKEIYSSEFKETCISPEELKLYHLINSYRKKKRLPPIPLSKSLTYVAQTHAKERMANKPDSDKCNDHSWSLNEKWSSCCYTPDHKQKECMWNKPKELTSYSSFGYEIAYWYSAEATPDQALNSWQKSKGHNEIIINSGVWKNLKWKAIGVGIYKNYAMVWFGNETDNEGEPKKCEN